MFSFVIGGLRIVISLDVGTGEAGGVLWQPVKIMTNP